MKEKGDVITLIDVYEDIRKEERPTFHKQLGNLLSDRGMVILTTPTVAKQTYLRTHPPEQIQPVDEDISRTKLETLANDLGGALVHCEEVSIWMEGDYTHSIISRDPSCAPLPSNHSTEKHSSRNRRVKERFGLSAHGPTLCADRGRPIMVAIAQQNVAAIEEFRS